MNTEALKEQARGHEQKEEWLKAIDLYTRVADQLERDDQPDLSLYNRLGDLQIRVGNVERAVEHYERAIDLYVEAELPNNAIAICRKVVRNLPIRHAIFLRMGQIRAKQGFLTDARQNFLEYAERMQKADDLEEAFRALIEFVELAPEDLEARTALAAQLAAHSRTEEAVEQYAVIHGRLARQGRDAEAEAIAAKIRELDPEAVIPSGDGMVVPGDHADPDLGGFETTSLVGDFPILDAEGAEAEHALDAGGFDISTGGFGDDDTAEDPGDPLDDDPDADRFGDVGLELSSTADEVTEALPGFDSEDEAGPLPGFDSATALEPLAGLEGSLAGVEPPLDTEVPGPFGTPLEDRHGDEDTESAAADEAALELASWGDGPSDDVGDDESTDAVHEAPLDGLALAGSTEPEDLDADADETSFADVAASLEEPGFAAVEAAEDLDEDGEDADPLPLISYHDEEEAEDVLDASDFGVRDDPDGGEEYVADAEDLPDLAVDLSDLDASADADADADEESSWQDAASDDDAEAWKADGGASSSESWRDEAGEPAAEDWHDVDTGDLRPAAVGAELQPNAPDEDLLAALQDRLDQNPDDPSTWLALAQELHSRDRAQEASMALERAVEGFESQDDVDGAIRAARTQIAHAPEALEPRQRLVELAIRKNDPTVLTPAYLDLAECLVRNGEGDRARAVFQQVLVAEPDNATALRGLGGLDSSVAVPVQEVASSEDYVDLGSLVLDAADEKTTRWKVAAGEPSGDEEADFARMLSQFKEKVAENLEADDLAAHYDLGTAYKEMGLVEEAISEFQQALRAEATHLPTHELLGQCFMEKGQYEVAVRSMRRALDGPSAVEDELLGIYYQMARAHEELGNTKDALEFYEKVFALDINFQDVTERLRGLR